MAENTLKVKIKQRYDTEANWTSVNPVLLKGECAYSSDKGNLCKTGDGVSTWSKLSYNTADKANQLTINAGSATQPVYFSGGKPVACTYTLGKSVPSDAKFTDTNTWTALKGATTSAAGTAGYAPAPAAGAANRYLRSDGTWAVPPDTNTTYSNFVKSGTGAKAGLVPAPSTTAGTTKYLREDGTWQTPPNTTYTSLKNPYAITIQGNGTTLTNGTYDGSAAKTVNITPASIGAAATSHTHTHDQITDFSSYVYDATLSRTANTVLSAPNGSNGTATFRKLVAADIPALNYAGSNTAGGTAYNAAALYANPSGRQTSANVDLTSTSWNNRVTYMLATSAMTTGKPPNDAHILTFGWDTTAGWGAQLAIGDSLDNHFFIRGCSGANNKSEWGTWKTVLDSGNYTDYTVTKTGAGASGTWKISVSGNAATASKLGTSSVGTTTNPIYLNAGTATACSGRTVPGIKSASSATTLGWGTNNNYVPDMSLLAYWNGAYTGTSSNLAYCNKGAFGTIVTKNSGDYLSTNGGTLKGALHLSYTASNVMTSSSTNPQIIFSENGEQPVKILYTDYDSYRAPAGLKIIGGTGATPAWLEVEGAVYASAFSGNATTATTLQTARTINGTSFNGSANITTSTWGTTRTITIGATGKSVNGSANVSWSLAEIGAAASSHTHSYLPLSGGTMTGTITSSKTTSTYLAGNQGTAIINSTAGAGSYTMLAKMNSTNGYFTQGVYNGTYLLQYTAASIVTAGTNNVTKSVTLLDESGNSKFSGTVTATTFSGTLSGNAASSTYATNIRMTLSNPSSATTYYIPFTAGTTASTNYVLRGNDGLKYWTQAGTTSALGRAELVLGNSTKSGTAGNTYGDICFYGKSSGYTTLNTANASTSNYTITLPAATGTVALTSNLSSYLPLSGGTVTGAMSVNGTATFNSTAFFKNGVEILHGTPYIDFHFGNSTSDYTSRIVESSSGVLDISGSLRIPNSGKSLTIGDTSFTYDSTAKAIKITFT